MNQSTHWGLETAPNENLWDELFWILAQWICQQRVVRRRGGHEPGPGDCDHHIENPAVSNRPCDWCYEQIFDLMGGGHAGLLKLLQVYGSVAYAYGRERLSQRKAARHALQEMVEQARLIEGATELLADVSSGKAWWQLPLERDERGLTSDAEETDGLSQD